MSSPQPERTARRTGEKGTIAAPPYHLQGSKSLQRSSLRIVTILSWLLTSFNKYMGRGIGS